MKTVKNMMEQLTSTKLLYENLLETLRETDPSFPAEETQFQEAVASLKCTLTDAEANSLDAYLAAAREEVASAMVYTGWLGFQLNLDCWKNPVNKLMLDQDHEEITRERSFESVPNIKLARRKAEAAAKGIPENHKALLSDIGSYFSYLHTVAPKLAHLSGFRLADEFLYHVIPGYCCDHICTMHYIRSLEEYLRVDISDILDQ